MEHSNRIRYYYYISSVLSGQQDDPWCSNCKAFSNSLRAVRESLNEFETRHPSEIRDAPEALKRLFSEAKETLSTMSPLPDAQGQKKAGNCRMPEGVCFVKASKAILEKIS